MTPNKRDLKAYARFDGTGRVVPGSLVLRRSIPKNGNWKQMQAYECCDTFGACVEPLILEVQPFEQFYEFGFRVNSDNTVAGTIEWGDGASETFNLSGSSGYTYFGHTYSTPDWIPYTVKVFFTSVAGIDNLEIGDADWKTLSASNISSVFAGSSIEQVDGDGSLYTSLDVHDLPIQDLYSLESPNLKFLNVQGCTSLTNTELYSCAFETLDFSGCTNLYSIQAGTNPMTSLIIDDCPSITNLNVGNCDLSSSSVNYILQTLDANGLTGGFVLLSGGTNGAPSGAGATAKTNLQGKGWFVGTN
jgi:hypothetical protein